MSDAQSNISVGGGNGTAEKTDHWHRPYIEHRNVGIDYGWAEGRPDRLPALAAELVRVWA